MTEAGSQRPGLGGLDAAVDNRSILYQGPKTICCGAIAGTVNTFPVAALVGRGECVVNRTIGVDSLQPQHVTAAEHIEIQTDTGAGGPTPLVASAR